MNFNSLLHNYITSSNNLTEKSKKDYQNKIEFFIKWLDLNQITNPEKKDMLNYQIHLYSDGNKNSIMTPNSANAYLSVLKSFFKWLEENDLYSNITSIIKLNKIDKKYKKDSLDIDEATHLLQYLNEFYENKINSIDKKGKRYTHLFAVIQECKLRDYAILNLALHTGLRLIEIVRANIEDLRIQKVKIQDKQLKKHVLYIQGKGKNTKSDFVYLQESVYDSILDYLKLRSYKISDPLFVGAGNRNKGRLTGDWISIFNKKMLRNSGLINSKDRNDSRLSFHSFRHTTATLALEAGVSLEKVREMLRHSNISTTEIYTNGMERQIDPAELQIKIVD